MRSVAASKAAGRATLDGVPVTRDAFPRTIRLVSTARQREAVMKALADSEDELAALEEIEGATSSRLIAQDHGLVAIGAKDFIYSVPHAHFINAAFAYAKPQEPNRFNGPERGAWYAALAVETCLAEVSFHMTAFLARTGVYDAVIDYVEMYASLAGEYLDLRARPRHAALNPDPDAGYRAGNALAEAAMARGLNGIIYPSVRHKGGICFAVLWPHAVQSVAQGDVWRLTWNRSPEPVIARAAR